MKKKHDIYNNFLTFGQGVLFATAIITKFVYNKEDVINHHGYIASNKELAPLAKLVEVKND